MEDNYELKVEILKKYNMPYWIVRNLIQYSNCYINPVEERYSLIIEVLTTIFNEDIGIRNAIETGFILKVSEDGVSNAENWLNKEIEKLGGEVC